MESHPKYIAIGSIARVGKDTLAGGIETVLNSLGYSSVRMSLATPLKKECDEFLLSKFGISAFTSEDKDKKFIRDFLVTVGKMRRLQSEGTYFTDELYNNVLFLDKKPDFVIVPDLRYAHYPDDELSFFKSLNSFIINVDRVDQNGDMILPYNRDEEENSKKIKIHADCLVEWKTFNSTDSPDIRRISKNTTFQILKKFKMDY